MRFVREFDENNNLVDKYFKLTRKEVKKMYNNTKAICNATRRVRALIWDEIMPLVDENTCRLLLSITDDMTRFLKSVEGSDEV